MQSLQRLPACLLIVCILPTGDSPNRLRPALAVSSIEGKIVGIDESSLTVAPQFGAPRTFQLDASTLITIGQEVTDRSELGKGQRVRVLFDRRGFDALLVTVLFDQA